MKNTKVVADYEFLRTSRGGWTLQAGQHFQNINEIFTKLSIAQGPRASQPNSLVFAPNGTNQLYVDDDYLESLDAFISFIWASHGLLFIYYNKKTIMHESLLKLLTVQF